MSEQVVCVRYVAWGHTHLQRETQLLQQFVAVALVVFVPSDEGLLNGQDNKQNVRQTYEGDQYARCEGWQSLFTDLEHLHIRCLHGFLMAKNENELTKKGNIMERNDIVV